MNNVAPRESDGVPTGDPLQIILENMLDMICQVDIDGTYQYISPSYKSVLGYLPEELIGRSAFEFSHPDDTNRIVEAFKAAISNRAPGKVEYRYRHKNGHYIWLESVGTLLTTNIGAVRGVIISTRNITERKNSESALRESEERLRLTLDAINDGIWDWNILTGEAVLSPRWYTMLGFEPYELPQNYDSWRSLVHPDDLERAEQEINEHIASGEGYAIEIRMRTKSGAWLWILTRGNVVERDAEWRPVRMMGTHSDITERKRAEEKLKASESRYRNLYESMIDAFVYVDRDGHIIEFNEVYRQMLGYEPDELRNLTYIEITPEKWHAFEAEIIQNQAYIRGYTDIYEKEYRRKDGTIFPIELRAYLVRDDQGKPNGLWGIVRDITERKQAEDALKESEERYRRLFEVESDAIFLVDCETETIIDANPAALRMYGYGRE